MRAVLSGAAEKRAPEQNARVVGNRGPSGACRSPTQGVEVPIPDLRDPQRALRSRIVLPLELEPCGSRIRAVMSQNFVTELRGARIEAEIDPGPEIAIDQGAINRQIALPAARISAEEVAQPRFSRIEDLDRAR